MAKDATAPPRRKTKDYVHVSETTSTHSQWHNSRRSFPHQQRMTVRVPYSHEMEEKKTQNRKAPEGIEFFLTAIHS